jgi:uncharacterized iron-regulated protein
MHLPLKILLWILLLMTAAPALCHGEKVIRAVDREEIAFNRMIMEIRESRVILIGEDHQSMADHWRQIKVMKALNDMGVPLAVGLEMFTARDQGVLDDWVNGKLDEDTFAARFYENWKEPWPMYREIFLFARRHRLPMVGLNISREITRKVALSGFASLTGEERMLIPGTVTCQVDNAYMALVRRAFADHGMEEKGFIHFCEAQMLWNRAMAWYAAEYLRREPGRRLVILAGKGHAMKPAVPREILQELDLAISVLLPEDQLFTRASLSPEDTDYLFPR